MKAAFGLQSERSRVSLVLAFIAHQLTGTLGVMIAAPFAFAVIAPLLRLFGWTLYTRDFYRITTGTPYFPMQVGFAVLLGWILGRYLERRLMMWVWVLPAVLLLCFVITNYHMLNLGSFAQEPQSRLSYFFGRGCDPKNRCLDQMFTTLPFYSAVAYSLGAFLAPRRRASVAGRAGVTEV